MPAKLVAHPPRFNPNEVEPEKKSEIYPPFKTPGVVVKTRPTSRRSICCRCRKAWRYQELNTLNLRAPRLRFFSPKTTWRMMDDRAPGRVHPTDTIRGDHDHMVICCCNVPLRIRRKLGMGSRIHSWSNFMAAVNGGDPITTYVTRRRIPLPDAIGTPWDWWYFLLHTKTGFCDKIGEVFMVGKK